MEWARDSAFRFFPLVEDEDLGLALHRFDLATNKVLALVGGARDLEHALGGGEVTFHEGHLGGAWPTVKR